MSQRQIPKQARIKLADFNMKPAKLLTSCVVLVGLLTLVDIGVRVRQLRMNAFTKQFTAVLLYTNGTSGTLIKDRAKDQPLWLKWNFAAGDTVDFFVDGKSVLRVASVKEGRSETEVLFYGKDGTLISQWKARENGVFYMRTLYDKVGPRSEVWLNNTWHDIEVHTNQGKVEAGTILDGEWRRLITTNGVPGVQD